MTKTNPLLLCPDCITIDQQCLYEDPDNYVPVLCICDWSPDQLNLNELIPYARDVPISLSLELMFDRIIKELISLKKVANG